MSAALIIGGQQPALTIRELTARVALVGEVMRNVMKEGTHYGPAFKGDTKKNLHKPGADTLCLTFQLVPEFTVETVDLGNQHREVRAVCLMRTASGVLVGQGVGSCSTLESKYRWRGGSKTCPTCNAAAIRRSKKEWGGGYYCAERDGGCGAKFKPADKDFKAIDQQSDARVENPDIADTYNTVLKMAKKRCFVDAVITCTACSDMFTQDLDEEDVEAAGAREVEAETHKASAEKPAPTKPAELTPEEKVAKEEANRLYAELLKVHRGVALMCWEAGATWFDKTKNLVDARAHLKALDEQLGQDACDELVDEITASAGYSKNMEKGARLDRGACQAALARLIAAPAKQDGPEADAKADGSTKITEKEEPPY